MLIAAWISSFLFICVFSPIPDWFDVRKIPLTGMVFCATFGPIIAFIVIVYYLYILLKFFILEIKEEYQELKHLVNNTIGKRN